MIYLIIVTLIWAFSFSFIGIYLSGQVDSWFAVAIRIVLACIMFLPFLRFKAYSMKLIMLLIGIGACQLSIMYFFYYHSFQFLTIPEILLFTIFTPIYVTIIYDILKSHHIRWNYLFCAFLSVMGSAIIRYDQISQNFLIGFLLIQCANLIFAFGQVGYKRLIELYPIRQYQAFSWVYLGAAIVAVFGWILFGDMKLLPKTPVQWLVIFWLGVVASGLCYFLWNYGATKVDAGVLAIMNNAVIPTGILVNVLLWGTKIEWLKFTLGSVVIIIALILHAFLQSKAKYEKH